MRLSVVIPTKNEEANIGNCLGAFVDFVKTGQSRFDKIELIVVDNFSSDRTREIAAEAGAKVFLQGPERCAQRNRGWREATGEVVMFVDADMIVPEATLREIENGKSRIENESGGKLCLYIPEVRAGKGLRIKARNFERSFYDGTVIDGLRVIPRALLEAVGGYDEKLVACEDWDLDRRLKAAGAVTAITKGHLIHNEARQNFRKFLAKKAYYSKSVEFYREKWRDGITAKQFGFGYRYFGVFTENGKWKKLVRHPVLAAVMYSERIAVGATFLLKRN